MRRLVKWSTLVVSLAAIANPSIAFAQKPVCVIPAGCRAVLDSTAKDLPFIVRIEIAKDTPQSVYVTGPANLKVNNVRDGNDKDRYKLTSDFTVMGYLEGGVSSDAKVEIRLSREGYVFQSVEWSLREKYRVVRDTLTWFHYAGSQLRPIVRLNGILSDSSCSAIPAVFKASSGTISPDTLYGVLNKKEECEFKPVWRLDANPGLQFAQARIGTSAPLTIKAVGRRKSRLNIALGLAYTPSAPHLKEPTSPKYVITRVDSATNTTIQKDTIAGTVTVENTGWDLGVKPYILLDTPVRPGYTHTRLAIGTPATENIGKELFLGFSGSIWKWGLQAEDTGVDLMLGVIANGAKRIKDPKACQAILTSTDPTGASCRETTQPRLGVAFFLSTEASALISSLGKVLGIS